MSTNWIYRIREGVERRSLEISKATERISKLPKATWGLGLFTALCVVVAAKQPITMFLEENPDIAAKLGFMNLTPQTSIPVEGRKIASMEFTDTKTGTFE